MAKRANPRAVKAALTYTIEEAAEALDVSIPTVRTWQKKGLHVMTAKRPYLISGIELREFLEKQHQDRKQPLQDDELYCTCCKRPTKPFGAMADYIPMSSTTGRIVSICSTCDGTCSRFASKDQLSKFMLHFEILIREPEQD